MSETLTLTKPELIDIAKKRMLQHLNMPAWPVRQKLALTCRILHSKGHESGLAGQISGRGEKEGTFYTQQLGLGFDEITSSNLLKVDEDLNVLEGEGMANPANRFHTWIYQARPDINCIIHTHPTYSVALAMLERPLKIAYMDVCVLYDDVAFLPIWTGVPVGNEEGKVISETLGNKRAVLLCSRPPGHRPHGRGSLRGRGDVRARGPAADRCRKRGRDKAHRARARPGGA